MPIVSYQMVNAAFGNAADPGIISSSSTRPRERVPRNSIDGRFVVGGGTAPPAPSQVLRLRTDFPGHTCQKYLKHELRTNSMGKNSSVPTYLEFSHDFRKLCVPSQLIDDVNDR